MVTPAWGQFQKPQRAEEQIEAEETLFQQQEQKQEVEDKPQPQWGQFKSPTTYQGEPDPTEEESTIGYWARNLTANASRVAESALGKYGDVQEAAKGILTNMPSTGGLLGYALSEWVGQDTWKRMINGPENGINLPTTQKLKQASEVASGGYTKAKTPGEEKFQEFTQDVGSISSIRRRAIPTLRDVGIAGLANVGKQATKELGFGEDKATNAKMGIWTVLSLLDKVNAPRYAAQMMNRARNGFNPNLQANVPAFEARLNALAASPSMLASDPRSALARQQINQIQSNIANGQNSIQSLLTTYDGVNAAKKSSGMFELGRPGDRRFASHALDQVLGVVRDEIQATGASNPQALREWKNGIRAWRTIHESNNLSNWVQSLSKGEYKDVVKGAATALFGAAAVGAHANPLVAGTLAATGFAANKAYQVGYRVMNDPTLAEYYTNALAAAARQDAPVFIANYKKLNKELEKDSVLPEVKPVSKDKTKNTGSK